MIYFHCYISHMCFLILTHPNVHAGSPASAVLSIWAEETEEYCTFGLTNGIANIMNRTIFAHSIDSGPRIDSWNVLWVIHCVCHKKSNKRDSQSFCELFQHSNWRPRVTYSVLLQQAKGSNKENVWDVKAVRLLHTKIYMWRDRVSANGFPNRCSHVALQYIR